MKINYKIATAVDRCSKFARQHGVLEEFSYLYFKDNTISAYNGFSGIIHLMDEGFEAEGMAVPSDIVSKLLNSLKVDLDIVSKERIAKSEKVEEKTGTNILIESKGKFVSKLATPYINKNIWNFSLPDTQLMKSLDSDFFPCVRKVYFSVCKDETKPHMKAVYCDGEYIYSTDNYRISRYPFKFEDAKGLTIPDSLLELIVNEKTPVGYAITGDDKKLWFLFGEKFLVFVNSFTLNFPNCSASFESLKDEKEEVEFSSEEFMSSLKRFELLNPTWPQRIYLVVNPPSQLFIMTTISNIEAVEQISCKTSLSKARVCAVNLKFLSDAVDNTNKFSITENFLYFKFQKESIGLESLLLFLEAVDEDSLLKKAQESIK